MVKKKLYKLSQNANLIITGALKQRIPCFSEFRLDDNCTTMSRADLFGNIDTLLDIGGEEIYKNQNKSRLDNRQDICIECRSYRSKTVNAVTNKRIPIEGAYWYETGKCWLSPRWGGIDTLTVYLPGPRFIGHFNRYYLDIMFSKEATWESMTGIHKENNDSDTYIVFFNFKRFCELYLKTVESVTCGNHKSKNTQNYNHK